MLDSLDELDKLTGGFNYGQGQRKESLENNSADLFPSRLNTELSSDTDAYKVPKNVGHVSNEMNGNLEKLADNADEFEVDEADEDEEDENEVSSNEEDDLEEEDIGEEDDLEEGEFEEEVDEEITDGYDDDYDDENENDERVDNDDEEDPYEKLHAKSKSEILPPEPEEPTVRWFQNSGTTDKYVWVSNRNTLCTYSNSMCLIFSVSTNRSVDQVQI